MDASLTYIESYFTGQLSDAEKKEFEQLCVQDENFAADVAFYITAREGVRSTLLAEKNTLWSSEENKEQGVLARLSGTNPETVKEAGIKNTPGAATTTKARRISLAGWISYAAAACLILAFAFYFVNRQNDPRRLASTYVEERFTRLPTTMGTASDSLKLGITAYNDRKFPEALGYFENVANAHPENDEALRFTGLTYLMQADYDNAIQRFERLAAMPNLEVNSGLFLKAVTLMERDKPGDRAAAKTILSRVVNEQLGGDKQAKAWLEKWKD
jgi:tetratricopeptide (TPR) repeat protein